MARRLVERQRALDENPDLLARVAPQGGRALSAPAALARRSARSLSAF